MTSCADIVEHGVTVPISLRPSCDPSPESIDAETWRIRATTKDVEGWTRTFTTFPEAIALPKTTDAVLTVEALQGERVIARGVSLHVEVNDTGANPSSLLVDVFPLGRITRQCGALNTPRSGHSATLMHDGSVLIAAGLNADGLPLSSLESISRSVELVGDLVLVTASSRFFLPRAFHSALLLDNGQVVFAGGEQRNTMGGPVPLNTVVFVDPNVGYAAGVLSPTQSWSARTRHAAFKRDTRIFIAGGITIGAGNTLAASRAIDRLKTDTNTFEQVRFLSKALDESAVTMTATDIVLAGGTEANQPSRTVQLMDPGTGLVRETQLREARAAAFAVPLGDRVLIGGGVGASSNFLGSTEFLEGGTGPDLVPRSRPCAVSLDQGVFIFGGVDGVGGSGAAEWITLDGTKSWFPFGGQGRFDHSCTKLEDGSVLIVGGRNLGGPLNDLWRFVPPQ